MSMKEKLQVFHIEKPQAMGLQLYYESRALSLLILLPEDIEGLDQVPSVCCEGGSDVHPSGEKHKTWSSCLFFDACRRRQPTYLEPPGLYLHSVI